MPCTDFRENLRRLMPGLARASAPQQLFSCVFWVQKRGARWNHVFGNLSKGYLNGFWGAISSFLCPKDCFRTEIYFFIFHQKFEGPIWSVLQAIYTFRVLLVFASILMNP